MEIEQQFTEVDPYKDDNQDVINCLRVWESMRGTNPFPRWSDMDWMAFPTSIIAYFVVCDVQDDPLDYVYRFWGTSHTRIFHKDFTGKSVRDISPRAVGEGMFAQHERAIELKKTYPICV